LIDQGRNPDLYSKEALEKCIKMNEVSKGKIDALEVRKKSSFFLMIGSLTETHLHPFLPSLEI